MKSFVFLTVGLLSIVTGCKKDEDSPAGTAGGGSSYMLKAPACVVVDASTIFGNIYVSYDSQKRIIKQTQNNDSNITTYAYMGNTIVETSTEKLTDGSTQTSTSTHYLNASGMIDSTVFEDLSFTTYYYYNSQGYLIRKLNKSQSGSLFGGLSYQYVNGNKVSEYSLSFNWQTGAIEDSTLSTSFSYYPNMAGKLEEWEAWTNRAGKASVNAVKTIDYGTEIETYTYSLDAHGNPIKVDINGVNMINITWSCR